MWKIVCGRVQEGRGDEAPRLGPPEERREGEVLRDARVGALREVDDRADADDRVGDDGRAVGGPPTEDGASAGRGPGGFADAVDALDADGGGPLALGARGPAAALAAHVGLAVGVARAHGRTGSGLRHSRLERGLAGLATGRVVRQRGSPCRSRPWAVKRWCGDAVVRWCGGSVLDGDRVEDDVLDGLVVGAGGDGPDLVDDVARGLVGDLAEDRVLALEPGGSYTSTLIRIIS